MKKPIVLEVLLKVVSQFCPHDAVRAGDALDLRSEP
jgi:hypothetical protein